MRKTFARFTLFILIFSIFIALSGCFGQPAPSQNVLKKTAAAVTVAAMVKTLAAPYTQTAILRTVIAQFTQTASAGTPLALQTIPSVAVTPVTVMPTVNSALCNWAYFVADITYPDGSVLTPGEPFRKTWRIQNSGSCTWDGLYSLRYERGQQMDAPGYQPLVIDAVPSGGLLDVSVDMVAPAANGSYQAYFRLYAPDGSALPVGNRSTGGLWALISVNRPQPCNWAALISDVTYPDNTRVDPGQAILKKWRLQNLGTCTWSPEYALIFTGGNRMGAPDFQQLSHKSIPPSGVVDVGVNLVAPPNNGTYQAFFKIRSAKGEVFGTGYNADQPIWAKIIVGPTPTFTPTNTLTPSLTPTATTPPPTATSTFTPSATQTPSETVTPSETPTETLTPSPTNT